MTQLFSFFREKSTDFAVIFQLAHLDLAIHQTECLQEHAALALTFVPRTCGFTLQAQDRCDKSSTPEKMIEVVISDGWSQFKQQDWDLTALTSGNGDFLLMWSGQRWCGTMIFSTMRSNGLFHSWSHIEHTAGLWDSGRSVARPSPLSGPPDFSPAGWDLLWERICEIGFPVFYYHYHTV